MSNEVIVEIVAGCFIIASVVITGLFNNKKTKDRIKEQSDITVYRLDKLEAKQDKHNHIIERMYKAEDEIHIMQEKIKVQNHRIEDLETFHKPK